MDRTDLADIRPCFQLQQAHPFSGQGAEGGCIRMDRPRHPREMNLGNTRSTHLGFAQEQTEVSARLSAPRSPCRT